MSFSFLYDWFFYGGLVGAVGVGITIYLYGRKIGHANLNWKHYAIILPIWMFPTMVLPFLLMPGMSMAGKTAIVIGLIFFLALKYYTTTKAQEGMTELRRLKNRAKEDQEEEHKDDFKVQ
jgi:hypothetical protein